MAKQNYRYIYGPVPSWRLGSSLGIDPIAQAEKACTFDCVYCQLGRARPSRVLRKTFVPTAEMIRELASLPPIQADYMTFSGTGEPTMAENLGEMIRAVRGQRSEKIAVLTNSSLLFREDVVNDLSLADFVVAKLDASSQDIFELVNRPAAGGKVDALIQSLKDFRSRYAGRLALQVMCINENKACVKDIARIAKEIDPDEVQLNTPLRPCGIAPLTKEEMAAMEGFFSGLPVVSVYKAEKKNVAPISSDDTLRRRGKV